jgi:histone H3/H4
VRRADGLAALDVLRFGSPAGRAAAPMLQALGARSALDDDDAAAVAAAAADEGEGGSPAPRTADEVLAALSGGGGGDGEEDDEEEESTDDKGAGAAAGEHAAALLGRDPHPRKSWPLLGNSALATLTAFERATYPFVSRLEKSESLKYYSRKVLRQFHPEVSLSRIAKRLLDVVLASAFNAVMERVVAAAPTRGVILPNDVLKGLEVLPGELFKHAQAEAVKACRKAEGCFPGEPGGLPVSVSAMAGLQFPVRRFGLYAQRFPGVERVSFGAAVSLAAAIEYLCAEVLELSGNAARDMKRSCINAWCVQVAIRADEELAVLFTPILDAVAVRTMQRKERGWNGPTSGVLIRRVLAPHVRAGRF